MKTVSGKRFCKILEKHGWVLKHIGSSHHTYKKAGNPTIITVPVHRNADLKKGMQAEFMKIAGLTDDDIS